MFKLTRLQCTGDAVESAAGGGGKIHQSATQVLQPATQEEDGDDIEGDEDEDEDEDEDDDDDECIASPTTQDEDGDDIGDTDCNFVLTVFCVEKYHHELSSYIFCHIA